MKYLVLFCFLLCSYAYAQESTVSGKVTDENDLPVPYVSVLVKGNGKGTTTDEQGNYRINFRESGKYTLVFSAIGYTTVSRKVEIIPGNNTNINVTLGESLEQLSEVVITSNRTRETLDEVPSSVSVLSSTRVRALAETSNSVAEILTEVPGITLSTNQTSNSGQTLRGRNMLVLIDGIPQSTPLRKGGRDINTIDPSTIERIEVIKGATAIYGNGADGGIVNYITKKPKSNKKLESTTVVGASGSLVEIDNTVGSNITQTFSGHIDKFKYVASAGFRQTGVFKDADGVVTSPYYGLGETSQYSLFGKLNYTITDRQSVELMYNYFSSNQDTQYITQLGEYGKTPSIGVPGEEPGEDQGNRYNHNIQLTYDYNRIFSNTDFRLNMYYQGFKTVYGYTENFYDPDLGYEGGQSSILSTKKGARFNFKTSYDFGAVTGDILYGMDALNDKTSQELVDGRPWVPQLDMNNFAPYAQLKAMYGNFVLKAGIRFENIKIDIPDYTTLTRYNAGETTPNSGGVDVEGGKLNYNATTFNVGLRYNKWSFFKPFVSFSQSFSIADLGRILRSATENTVSQVDPEAVIANNYEIGFNSRLGNVYLSGAGFISTSDLGSTYNETESGAFEILRQPEKVYGFEFSLNTQLMRNLDFGTSVSYTEGKLDSDDNGDYESYMGSERISPVKVVSYLSYKWQNKFDIRLSHIFSGDRDRFEPIDSGDYTYGKGPVENFSIVNLTTHYQLTPSTKLGVGIKNLFNTDYYPLIAQWAARDFNYIKANGTQFNVSLTVKL
ncbi:TonB-dependent receptor [Sinomicrobium weinanense]|uniref:TonB-dependent receptor n=1 Tax=Sinomicrobium weinanense TaxID=2842200 RepID=A0A926JQ74_9FLAO|nr:TonB-dependent receptor [Sinomicrobium weinanense]MBC9795282.1 TonB-dependent receptor [Sinomicrobium weinanense]MBU3125754.1 TonB-dependent receptor [Sinomicrobium weinanense]